MQRTLLALSLGVACATAAAADAPQPQPSAGSGAIAAAKAQHRPLVTVMPSPSVMQTTAYVQADGSVALVCDQVRNPHPQRSAVRQAAPVLQQ